MLMAGEMGCSSVCDGAELMRAGPLCYRRRAPGPSTLLPDRCPGKLWKVRGYSHAIQVSPFRLALCTPLSAVCQPARLVTRSRSFWGPALLSTGEALPRAPPWDVKSVKNSSFLRSTVSGEQREGVNVVTKGQIDCASSQYILTIELSSAGTLPRSMNEFSIICFFELRQVIANPSDAGMGLGLRRYVLAY